jgi:hypothetical protein
VNELKIKEYSKQIGSTEFVIDYLDSGEWQLSYWPASRNHYHFGSPKKSAEECIVFLIDCMRSESVEWKNLLGRVPGFTLPSEIDNLSHWIASSNSSLSNA